MDELKIFFVQCLYFILSINFGGLYVYIHQSVALSMGNLVLGPMFTIE